MQVSPSRERDARLAWPKMRQTRLQDLSGSDLSTFVVSSMMTWGNVNDFKHFLPRILELAAQLDEDLMPEVATGKLNIGNWRSWPAKEQQALRGFGLAWWQRALEPPAGNLTRVLGILAQFLDQPDEVHVLLDHWRPDFSNAHVDLLARFVVEQSEGILKRPSTFSSYLKPIDEPLAAWVSEQLGPLNEALMYDPQAPPHWQQARRTLESIQHRLS